MEKIRRFIPDTKYKILNTNPGFTLIELLVVGVIIGILATLGGFNYLGSQNKAFDAQRKTDLKENLTLGLELYNQDFDAYPLGTGTTINGCGLSNNSACNVGSQWTHGSAGTVYMSQVPGDPRTDSPYPYFSDGTFYQLYAFIERSEDPILPVDGSGNPLYYDGTTCSNSDVPSGRCNFGVSSPNTRPDAHSHTLSLEP